MTAETEFRIFVVKQRSMSEVEVKDDEDEE